MFCANTSTREPRALSTIARRSVNGTQIATSTPSTAETRGQQRLDVLLGLAPRSCTSSSCPRSAACAAISAAHPGRHATPGAVERRDAGQRRALDQLERGAAAGREVVDARPRGRSARARRRSRRRRRPSGPGAAATASATARVPAANGSSSKAPIGPFQNTVPAARDLAARRRAAVRGADVEAHPAVGHVHAVEHAVLGVGRRARSPITRSTGSSSRARAARPRRRARGARARRPRRRTASRRPRGPARAGTGSTSRRRSGPRRRARGSGR